MAELTREAFDEARKVSENMIKYGGSFVRNLGHALMSADGINTKKIKIAFREYWERYLKI